jgi:hypothetical protein
MNKYEHNYLQQTNLALYLLKQAQLQKVSANNTTLNYNTLLTITHRNKGNCMYIQTLKVFTKYLYHSLHYHHIQTREKSYVYIVWRK